MEEQFVKITLDQWDEYQSLLRHKKEVKVIEEFDYGKDGKGTSVTYKSDSACWFFLAGKLKSAGGNVKDKIKEIEEIKKMSIREFITWRKNK